MLPDLELVDHLGRRIRWTDFRGQPLLVEFIFTRCPDICQKMSSDFSELVHSNQSLEGLEIQFLSITFDPEHDSVERLAQTAARYRADGERWRFARIEDKGDLETTLDVFGVVALPSALSGFEHNVAIHGVDSLGRLSRIVGIDETKKILTWALSE